MRCAFLFALALLSACSSGAWNNIGKNQVVMVLPTKPIWISGVNNKNLDYSADFPMPQHSEYVEVVNAGYWLFFVRNQAAIAYELTLNINNLSDKKMYTRAILENPQDASSPFVYEHYMLPEEKSTRVRHSPVIGVQVGKTYGLVFEFYADPERTVLLERIEQPITASFDNTVNCIESGTELKNFLRPYGMDYWPSCVSPE